ncbi:MAG: hypothetical protein NC191_10025, partial [Muribaculaceae bacterium]|nr:hypothetical protein [Muribaculaceae bacterium]
LVLFGFYNDEEYILIKNFTKHQKIDKPSKFRYIEAEYKDIFEIEGNTRGVLQEQSPPNVNENVKENGNGKEKENFPPISFAESDKSRGGSFSSFSNSEKEVRMRQFKQELEAERRTKSNAG